MALQARDYAKGGHDFRTEAAFTSDNKAMTILRPTGLTTRRIERVRADGTAAADDVVASEEPLEIRLVWQEAAGVVRKRIAVTMRTPGNDFELAAGFLYGEGVVQR